MAAPVAEWLPLEQDDGRWVTVGDAKVKCPTCGELIPFGVEALVKDGGMMLRPDVTDIWAHSYEHEEAR
jgi:hypothetical protein